MANEVKLTQPKKGVHVYVSTDEAPGYEISMNEDKRTWTLKKDGEVLASDFLSRGKATDAATRVLNGGPLKVEEATPAPSGSASATQPKAPKPLSGDQAKILTVLSKAEAPMSATELQKETELEIGRVYSVAADLSRRKFSTLSGEGSTITDAGREALKGYVPGARKAPTGPKDPAAAEASREAYLVAKYGPRPEGIGPRPTSEEWYESAIANAQASVDFNLMDQRLHAYSPIAANKVKAAKERLQIWVDKYEEYKKERDSKAG